jgi:3-hydroxyisobutyrate dehydrogenase-like beta-hydroxyacid dehydrogenase
LLWFGQAIATAEALLLARRAELDLDVLRQALTSSAASSVFIRDHLGALLAAVRSCPTALSALTP